MCSKRQSSPKRVTFDLPHENITTDIAMCSTTENDKQMHSGSRVGENSTNASKKNLAVKKVLVRHSEMELPSNKLVSKIPGEIRVADALESNLSVPHAYKPRYAVPELFSALCVAKEFQDKKIEVKTSKCLPIPVAVRQTVEGKAVGKLNFSPDEQLFKDLVALNVNDEILLGAAMEERSTTWKLPKDDEPTLSDFYVPKFVGEYTAVTEPTLSSIGKIRHYNGFSTYKRMMAWKLSESS